MDIINHCHIEFENDIEPYQHLTSMRMNFNEKESEIITNEIGKLLKLGVLKIVEPVDGQYLSPIFVRPKKNGEYRMILNLKKLNEHVEYHHFKMDTLESALKLITKNTYMASIDLRHAYYSVPIAEEHQKYLRFEWMGNIFQYTCLPNGISFAPRYFTKITKPIYSKLRTLGFINVGYIDDSLLLADSLTECEQNVQETVDLMTKLGFMVHTEKSVFKPTKLIMFLGNMIDSEKMIVYLTDDKKDRIIEECSILIRKESAKIRDVAKVIGIIVSSFPAVEFGKLWYRNLENAKINALKSSAGNYDSYMHISDLMKEDLEWWIKNIKSQFRHISHGNPEVSIETDASLKGYGAVLNEHEIGGRWSEVESQNHINYLEMLAILFAIKSFLHMIRNRHVKILTDSSTAVSYISNFGGQKSFECNKIAKEIWLLCKQEGIWLTCTHIAGSLNVKADKKSRQFEDQLEWKLDQEIFAELCQMWPKPDIDLFATRLNCQLNRYCSWKPDPSCLFVDAFSIDWSKFSFNYLFPPFSVLNRCIYKMREDGARGLIIAPLWTTQTWFPRLMELLVDKPVILPNNKDLLQLPHSQVTHPLNKTLLLIACRVSGLRSENEAFLQKLPLSSCRRGEQVLGGSTKFILRNGIVIVVKNKLVRFNHL